MTVNCEGLVKKKHRVGYTAAVHREMDKPEGQGEGSVLDFAPISSPYARRKRAEKGSVPYLLIQRQQFYELTICGLLMPGRARIALAGNPVHPIQRGNNRSACIFAEEDYALYLHYLEELAAK